MKYREIKKILTDQGFVLESYQTDSELDSLEFVHPNINGNITVHFADECEIPNN